MIPGPVVNLPNLEPPPEGEGVEVAEGILWFRLPLEMALNHVNVYALRDGEGWVLVDTGMHSKASPDLWKGILEGPLGGRPVSRILLTHHHPDHVGMAGWLRSERGSEIWSTRTAWLMARMLTLDVQERPSEEALEFNRAAGVPREMRDEYAGKRPFNFADCVYPLPVGFKRIDDGMAMSFGDRNWTVRIGSGHAPGHATFWSEDSDLVIGGDQFLADITSHIGVYPGEPEADPLRDWLESCARFRNLAEERHVVLPGHKSPYRGLPRRLDELIANHVAALDRLRKFLIEPRTTHETLESVFGRRIGKRDYGMALVEAIAHVNYLHRGGEIARERGDDGAWRWKRRPDAAEALHSAGGMQ